MAARPRPFWILAALLVLAGCRPDPPPPVATLVGFRALLPVAGEWVPLFDPEALPVLRVEAGTPPFAVHWAAGEVSMEATVSVERRGEARLVRVVGLATPPSGEGSLTLRGGRGGERHWLVRWGDVPSATAETPRPMGALPVEHPDFAPMLWAGVTRARAAQTAGTPEKAISAWLAAADDAERLGVPTEVGRRLRAAIHLAVAGRRLSLASHLIERARSWSDPIRDPAGQGRLRFSQAWWSYMLDDWLNSRKAYEDAISVLSSYGDDSAAYMATEGLAVLLSDLGDTRGASRILSESIRPSDAATQARFLTNLGWFALRAQEASPDPRALPALRARLAEARRAFAPIDPAWTANAATNEAWAALLARDLPAVHAHLAEVARLDPAGQGFGAPYAALVGARLALAEGRLDDAARRFAAVEARARRDVGGGDAELGWRARFGAGRVAQTRGDAAAAIGHFTAALAEVERLGLRASVRGDRAVFHADRRALVVETVALLVAEGRVDAAFEVADAARVRPLRALKAGLRVGALDAGRQARWAAEVDGARDAIEAWRAVAAREGLVPLAEEAAWRAELEAKAAARDRALDGAFAWLDAEAPLTVPPGLDGASARALLGEDEALVAFGPGRWVFRVTRGVIAAREVAPGEDLLGPWRDGLGVSPANAAAANPAAATPVGADLAAPVAPIRHVYLVAGDRGAAVFALPTAGPRPLLADVSVAFLPYAGVLANSVTRAAGAPLVVADPRADLAHAAAEGRAVAAALPGARLLLGSAATLDATLAGLATAPVFHFAGHGVLRPEQPWDAHLRLAGFDRLGLAEVLTHPVAARLVVLSGCETGTDAVLADERVVGLPEAFLAAGAQAVVATDRPVDDAVTRRFVARFYAAGGATAPAAALRVAALALRDEGEALWSAFRLIGLR